MPTDLEADLDDIKRISEKIFEVVKGEDNNTVFCALVNQFVFHMSLACPDCRKNSTRKLKREIPRWLEHANRVAAKYETTPSCH
jgi:hypothetical protein